MSVRRVCEHRHRQSNGACEEPMDGNETFSSCFIFWMFSSMDTRKRRASRLILDYIKLRFWSAVMTRAREFSMLEPPYGTDLGLCLDFDQASAHVQWMIIRKNSSFLHQRKLGTFTHVRQSFQIHSSWPCVSLRNLTTCETVTPSDWTVSSTLKCLVSNPWPMGKVLCSVPAVWKVRRRVLCRSWFSIERSFRCEKAIETFSQDNADQRLTSYFDQYSTYRPQTTLS